MGVKNLLILERSTSDLAATTAEDGSVVLEGVFTELGVKNKNNRIYEAEEVLPHIKELQAKVKTKKLLGELDHPKDFDISLSNVSHVIEDLTYDEANKQVRGRIRLLNTSKGKEAKALIEDGIPLHISSRAAGTVGNDNRVKIKKWFTYDLVADPGFENAELSRVNESFGFDDENLFIYEIDKPIYKIDETKSEEMTEDQKYVLAEDFNKYTEYLKTEITTLKEAAKGNENSKLEKLIEYSNKIAERVNGIVESIDDLNESQGKNQAYSNYLAENIGLIKEYTGYLAEELDTSVQYSNYVAEKADKGILYTESVAVKTDEAIRFGNYLAEGLNKGILYAEHLGAKLDESIAYAEYLKEGVQRGLNYSEYIAEQINIEYDTALLENKNSPTVKTLNESLALVGKETEYKDSLTESINALIKTAEVKNTNNLVFLNFLGEGKKREFEALTEEVKDRIVTSMNEATIMSSIDANRVWESCFMIQENKPSLVDSMPQKYKEKWNGLSEARKTQIIAESNFYPTETSYQMNNFWATRDLRDKQVTMERLDESKTATVTSEVKNQYAISEAQKADIISKMKFSLNR
jgi:hypothetical protein